VPPGSWCGSIAVGFVVVVAGDGMGITGFVIVACAVVAAVRVDVDADADAVDVLAVLTGGVVGLSVGAFVAGGITAVATAAATAVVIDAVPATVGTGRAVAVDAAEVGAVIGVTEGTGVTVTIGSLLHATSNMLRQAKSGTRSGCARRHGTVTNSLPINQPHIRTPAMITHSLTVSRGLAVG